MPIPQPRIELLRTHLSDNDYKIYGILSQYIDVVWRNAKPFIQNALKYGDNKYTLDSVKKALISRDMQLWLIYLNANIKGIVVTEIIQYPNKKYLTIVLLSGVEFDAWAYHWSTIKEWAIGEGCEAVQVFGRPGWERKLKTLGFEKIHTVLRLDF